MPRITLYAINSGKSLLAKQLIEYLNNLSNDEKDNNEYEKNQICKDYIEK